MILFAGWSCKAFSTLSAALCQGLFSARILSLCWGGGSLKSNPKLRECTSGSSLFSCSNVLTLILGHLLVSITTPILKSESPANLIATTSCSGAVAPTGVCHVTHWNCTISCTANLTPSIKSLAAAAEVTVVSHFVRCVVGPTDVLAQLSTHMEQVLTYIRTRQ